MASFMSRDPAVATSNTGDRDSFAYTTVRERWPKILESAIEDIQSSLSPADALPKDDVEAGKKIRSQLAELKLDFVNNAVLVPMPDDGGADIRGYNEELQALGNASWLSAPWLYTECYMYRLINTFFSISTPKWQAYDIFGNSKREGLLGSKKGTIELIKHFHEMQKPLARGEDLDDQAQKALFEEVVQISLWGNATDLSMLTTLSVEELNSRQGKVARESARKHIIADDTDEVWKLLSKLRSSGSQGETHIVLDNAGFELLTDIVLAGYLLDNDLARKVVLHGKRMPWFVSDVNQEDIMSLVDGFAGNTVYEDISPTDKQELSEAGKYWQQLLRSGRMEFRAHSFWTTAHPFGRMADVEPKLFAQIANADLVIYKGDLNYRKLTYDCYWPKTTPFSKALGPLGEKRNGKGSRSFALRTSKADVCVGLPLGLEEQLEDGWTRTGKYAVASYCDAKS